MNKVKITDIAQKSGVSLTTVSRYFNHPELLSPETQNKIKEAIKDLNYSQNNLARILVTGQSNLVGVIFPHLHLSFYTELLNQLVKYGKEKGYSFIIYTSNNSKEEEMHLIQNLISYRIKSLILLSHLLSPQEIEALPVPVISIERAGGNFKQINNDNFTGGKLAADLLIRNGCEVFIHINGNYKIGSYASEASAAVAYNKAADLAKTFGVTKQFPENYVDTLNPREYAELYTHVKISKKYIDYLKTFA